MAFLLEYFKHPHMISAVASSGKNLSKKIIDSVDFQSSKVIVEYGPGTGVFTKEILMHRKEGTVLILIEQNLQFCRELSKSFSGFSDLYIINGNAEKVNDYLKIYGFKKADCIISGIPFSSQAENKSHQIMEATKNALSEKGSFITFQYSLLKKKFFEHYFNIASCEMEMKNLPPAYVLVMNNQ